MRLSRYFLPILSQAPPEAELASHALMLRAGLVREEAPGIFAWLPLGLRVLDKVCAIVRTELDRTGALEMLMPTIQPIELWERSGRSAVFGEEMLQLRDRHARRMLYGPSAEEIATDLMQASAPGASDLPRTLYQISWKFRDQQAPHSGTLHAREFLMKDAYAFDLDPIAASHAYNRMFVAYLRIFDTIGLEAIPVLAEPGQFGGEFSHEFVVPVASGETTIHCDRAARDCSVPPPTIDFDDVVGLQGVVDAWTSHYAAVGGMHEPAAFQEVAPESRETIRGIEVGHIFYLGTTYSEPMQASVAGPDGAEIPLYMGSFGLGLSRLVAAIVEVHHDDFGIVWPSRIAPFDVALINLRVGHAATDGTCTAILAELEAAGFSVLYDDRDARPDAKIALADLIGLPWQVIVGPQVADTGRIELRRRANGERDRLPPIDLLARLRYA